MLTSLENPVPDTIGDTQSHGSVISIGVTDSDNTCNSLERDPLLHVRNGKLMNKDSSFKLQVVSCVDPNMVNYITVWLHQSTMGHDRS
jgi:hypothetical protein